MPYSSPPNPRIYYERVYEIVRAIPPGRVMAYGQIARLIPPVEGVDIAAYLRLSPRWVGAAMAISPDDVPWQRVINGQGKVSDRPGFGAVVQRKLLEQEAVEFDERDRVDLARFGWQPSAAWLREHAFTDWQSGPGDEGLGASGEQARLF